MYVYIKVSEAVIPISRFELCVIFNNTRLGIWDISPTSSVVMGMINCARDIDIKPSICKSFIQRCRTNLQNNIPSPLMEVTIV